MSRILGPSQEQTMSNAEAARPTQKTESFARDYGPTPADGFTDALQEQFGTAPWWVISAVVHALLLVILAFVVLVHETRRGPAIIVSVLPSIKLPIKSKPPVQRDRLVQTPLPVSTEVKEEMPLLPHAEVIEPEDLQTEYEPEMEQAQGDEEALNDIPMGPIGISSVTGLDPSAAGAWGIRFGKRRLRAVLRNHCSPASIGAVDAALA